MNSFEDLVSDFFYQKTDPKSILFDSFLKEDFYPIAIVDKELNFNFANIAFCNTLDLPNNHSINNFHISVLPFSSNPYFLDFLDALIKNKIPRFELETTFATLMGSKKTLKLKMVRFEGNEKFNGAILQLVDVTNHHQKVTTLEDRITALKLQNQQLQKYITNNLQLENFAYIASHDMKEPLRMIGNFSQLLAKRCGEDLNEECKEYLGFILNGVKNMNGFVDDLLMYSRLDRKEQIIQDTNVEILFYLLKREFEDDLAAQNAEIIIENVPTIISCCKEKVKILFQQMISNSLKYAKPDVPAKIVISGQELEDYYEFSVSDNGIGLNEEYAEKIFMMFKKLHPKSKYAGTGIGLAICKKIVDQHSGTIGVKSKVGEGSTFTFTLKKTE